jgi:transcriptional regulator with GAF, ATPase, and Fis domain
VVLEERAHPRQRVGTHERADLLLTDRTVSRLHCEILSGDGRLRVRDLGSRNGTRIDGVAVVEGFIDDGQTLDLGATRIAVRRATRDVEIALAPRMRFGRLVGASRAMRAVFAILEQAAAGDSTVLLGGETGTGKEAAARAVHDHSPRASGPFIVVDCGSIPSELLESELFGHERGAFTGAVATRRGAFEAAHGGTIFLDEIGELAPELQPKLLRALEERYIKRVGATTYLPVDVRVITATNRDLAVEVNAQRFRSDLYYRLAVVEVRLPALRDRPDDLPLLVEHLASTLSADPTAIAKLRRPEFIATLARHAWPGNVRELRNYLERCAVMGGSTPIEAPRRAETLPPITASAEARLAALERSITELRTELARPPVDPPPASDAPALDRELVIRMLGEHGGHIGRTAQALGVHRRTLERRLRALGLR